MLSASEPVIPYISGFTDRSSSPLNSSKDLLHHPDLECEWCKSLLDSQDVQGAKEFLLDMFGRCRGERQCFALLTTWLERVRRVKGPEAWQAFFEKQEEMKQPAGYMCLAHEVWSTYKTTEEAYEFAACAFDTFLVIALQAEPKKVKQIPWKRNSSSQVSFPRIVCSGSMSPSHFQHNLARFKYAGQLKKSSFSPYMPYSSVLSERVPKFAGDRTNYCGLIGSAQLFMKNPSAVLHSMVVHVLEDCSGDHYLVNITSVVWEEKGLLTLIPIMGEEPKSPTLSLPAKLKTEAKKSAMDLFTRSITRAPYIDSTEIRQKNIDLYQRSLPNQQGRSSPPVPFLPPVTHSLTEIADKLDEQRRKLELSKHAQVIYTTLNRPGLKESVQLAWLELTKNDLLRRFFQGVSEERIMLVAEQFYATLIQPRTSFIGKKIRQSHQNMRLTGEMYDAFANTLLKVLRTEGLNEEESEMLLERFKAYKQDLVTEV
jgi:truncated hemoglobin YjbI